MKKKGLPFDDGVTEVVCLEPVLCSENDLKELFCLRVSLQFGLAFSLLNPEDGIVGIGIDGLVVKSLLPGQCQSVDNSEEFTYVVRAVDRAIMKYLCPCSQVDGLVFHGTRIA